MKRSEMITQIADELHHELWGYLAKHSEHDDAVADAGIDLKDLALKVLDRIEQAGMLPPPYYDSFYHDEPECDGMIPEWEEEG